MAQPFANDGDLMQGVVKSYDPGTGQGVLLCDTDLAEYDLAANALEGSVFRMLRQGQRVVFDLDAGGRATGLSLGSEGAHLAVKRLVLHFRGRGRSESMHSGTDPHGVSALQ